MSINKYFANSVLMPILLYSLTVSLIYLNQTDDASSYIRYYMNAVDMIKNYSLRVIVNDIGFLSYLILLELISRPSGSVVLFFSYFNFILILTSVFCLIRNERQLGFLAALVIFTSPIIALGYIVHLRQGFALGIFILVLCFQNLNIKNIESGNNKILYASVVASFFYTSLLFILAVYTIHSVVTTFFKSSFITLTSVCVVVFSLSLIQDNAAAFLRAMQIY